MKTPAEALREYERKPFTLWDLKGKYFTILEDQPTNKNMRETNEINKWNKPQDFFFIKIEQGLFQKDLKMTENEMLAVFCALPKGVSNYQGSMLSVDQANKMSIKYLGSTGQDLQGNKIGTNIPTYGQSAPISQSQQPQDQKSIFLTKMIGSMRALESIGIPVDSGKLTKMCDSISPGNTLDMIQAAKSQGLICEITPNVFKVIE